MAHLIMREGILDRLKESRGIQTDEAMAKIGGVTLNTYRGYRDGKAIPNALFIAEIAASFGLGIGEIVELRSGSLGNKEAA